MDPTPDALCSGTAARSGAAPRRFVAVGDSFTEGFVDVDESTGGYRGWADRLAEHLAGLSTAGRPDGALTPLEYANLAVRGRLLPEIVREQLPRALRLDPDLVSLIGGGNDLLRPGADPDALAELLEDAVVRVRAIGADVLLATAMDTRQAPLLRRNRGLTAVFSAHVWSIAARHGCSVLDLWGMRSLQDRRMWAADRIHLTPAGHERVALAALEALGAPLPSEAPDWRAPLPPAPARARAAALSEDAAWVREHVLPWVGRRLRRRSSGTGRHGKRPDPAPVRLP
ncbi:lysophospholipase L1-like esterase [Kineococcus xinjiangensis]|uniref:Lysophospholipase L1-like esterase n=1 Tax=Kineococcus xinjiangensis TaxID=512762 RepID=A0A2S6IT59_9ACTN|nr:SGNH/GDSL hydrolase family protein [Kineococcus xinjiangensis]PPK97437.1 lysophospholipase L1-like esterase [Kineococcus xinjiangensis]